VRAETPGVDPARNIVIRLAGRVVRVKVTRGPTESDRNRPELHYGQSVATVVLPHDLNAYHLWAAYDRGVLTIASTTCRGGCPVASSGTDQDLGTRGSGRALSPVSGVRKP